MLGIYTQFNFNLWLWALRTITFGLFDIKLKYHKSSKSEGGKIQTSGRIFFTSDGIEKYETTALAQYFVEEVLKGSEKAVTLKKSKYEAYIKLNIELCEVSA